MTKIFRCSHYFCRSCAFERYQSGKTKCACCNAPTHGIFNLADKLLKRIAKKEKAVMDGTPSGGANSNDNNEHTDNLSSLTSEGGWSY